MKKVIIYIHGFNSGPGEKAVELTKQFPNCEVVAPQLPYNPQEAIEILKGVLDQHLNADVHIVGTSLGGFYTMYLSTLYSSYQDITYYLINPSFKPQETLDKYVDTLVTNYKTGEQFEIDSSLSTILQSYHRQIVDTYSASNIHSSNYFLSTNDEVLSFDQFEQYLRRFKVPLRIYYSNQGHRFQETSQVIDKLQANMIY
ncbi:COG3150 Predicted esterase [uncultured Caudovirales phage]|uniref:COG3150 Predicted esterase n=1 Tax=uncultured Caudovirales phage TaxID=2100421 RepID=A0A6J5KU14_9CAUD|nr:COG3150 Predicted esterase [uncultured Caudovirales phage]